MQGIKARAGAARWAAVPACRGRVVSKGAALPNTLLQTFRFPLGRKSPCPPHQSSALQSLLPKLIQYLWATIFYRWAVSSFATVRLISYQAPGAFCLAAFFKIAIPSKKTAATSDFHSFNKARREFSPDAGMED